MRVADRPEGSCTVDELPEETGYDLELVVLCTGGYSSSLVEDTLGLTRTGGR